MPKSRDRRARDLTIAMAAFVDKRVKTLQKEIVDVARESIEEHISLTDHSLKDLAAMGHPYRIGGPGLHGNVFIHEQTGNLKDSLKEKVIETPTHKIHIFFFDTSISGAWYLPYIIFGTSSMVPRDFIRASFVDAQNKWREVLKKQQGEGRE